MCAMPGGLGPQHYRHIPPIFNRKIIHLILKVVGTLEICDLPPELFQNYVLVPTILHIAPCLSFHNYN
jgi:hypothetical protein